MIKRKNKQSSVVNHEMRGGVGDVTVRRYLDAGEYNGRARLIASLTLEPGASIGEHVHENEEEIFIVLKGTAAYLDGDHEEMLYPGDSCIVLGGGNHSVRNPSAEEDTELCAVILTY